MGTCVAPKYAHLTMGYLEHEIKKECNKKLGPVKTASFFKYYFRFLDDIFVVCDLDYDDIQLIISIFNNFHSSFKFTYNISSEEAVFLDVKVIQQNNVINTDIYHKPTDSFNYLHFSSHHPSHIKRNIPYNLANRIMRIVSDINIRKLRFSELKETS